MNVFITGANGFIGRNLVSTLAARDDMTVFALVRDLNLTPKYPNINYLEGDILDLERWEHILAKIDVVVHTAGRAHIMNDMATDPITAFRETNTYATSSLAKSSAYFKVKRFIYLSSLKVHGEYTADGEAFTHMSKFDPQDAYAISKYEAENELQNINKSHNIETVIIRPPLVYGQRAKGNLAKLRTLIKIGVPLPLASIRNLRSLVSVENLVNLIVTCINSPNAKNKEFLVSDASAISTPDLISKIALEGGYRPRLLHCPPILLRLFFGITFQNSLFTRLCRSSVVDISHTKRELNWTPNLSTECFINLLGDNHGDAP